MSAQTFLIVDDSKFIRHVAKGILDKLGFETNEADDGDTALEACEKDMPDAILLDWNMPRMGAHDGIVFMRELRQRPGGGGPKILFCTAKNELEDVQQAITEGADEYIMKPFDEDIVRLKLEQVGLL